MNFDDSPDISGEVVIVALVTHEGGGVRRASLSSRLLKAWGSRFGLVRFWQSDPAESVRKVFREVLTVRRQ